MTAEQLQLLVSLLAPLAGGLGAYVAIRLEIADLKARLVAAEKRQDNIDRDIGSLREWVHSIRGDI